MIVTSTRERDLRRRLDETRHTVTLRNGKREGDRNDDRSARVVLNVQAITVR